MQLRTSSRKIYLSGYYRVNYDIENWQILARVLSEDHQAIHVLNRAQLLDDSFNLARTGKLVSFVLIKYYQRWKPAVGNKIWFCAYSYVHDCL